MPLDVINYNSEKFSKIISQKEKSLHGFLRLDILLFFIEIIILIAAGKQDNVVSTVIMAMCAAVTAFVGNLHIKNLAFFYNSKLVRFHLAVCNKTVVCINLSDSKKGEVAITVRNSYQNVEVTTINFSVAYIKTVNKPILDITNEMIYLPANIKHS